MKTTKLSFWISTSIIFLMEGVLVALTSQTEMAKEGIHHLGYPAYFGGTLALLKVTGSLVLMIPGLPKLLKGLAYAGFVFDFVLASISHFAVDGMDFQSFFPLIFLVILGISYRSYLKLNNPQ